VKRRASFAVLVAALLVLAGQAGAAGDGLTLRPAAGVEFPERAYVLSLPEGAFVDEESVKVRENGVVVQNVEVIPGTSTEAGDFGFVLVIDASESMEGPAIEGAVEAARAFAAHRSGNQVLAIVTFNKTIDVVLPFTNDPAEIDAALAQPPTLAAKTHLYDAVKRAVAMLEAEKVAAGSVIVLSDGADVGSDSSLDGAVAAAKDARIRVFSVGLRSDAYDADALETLASKAGGGYSEARTPKDLESIFSNLGAQLADEYLIRYRSSEPANRKVVVSVTVEGFEGAATAGYVVPASAQGVSDPFNRSVFERFVRSGAGMVSTALFAAALIGAALMLLVRPRRRGIKRKLAEFVSLPALEAGPRAAANKDLPFERAERSFEGSDWWTRFREELDVGRITIPPMHIVVWTSAATAITVYLLALWAGPVAALLGLSIPLIVRGMIRRAVSRQRQLFASQLPDNLQVLASALRAGHSLVGALSVVVEDSPEPSRTEFRRVIADEQLGVPLEDAIERVAERMKSQDLRQVGLVAALQHETGGNTAEVLDRVADTVRERFELRRLVSTLTAQGRMSRWILTGLPVFLLIIISVLNPDYISPLYTHSAGRVLLFIAAVMVTCGSLVIRRIINIKV
jgi:tight adherence protein B